MNKAYKFNKTVLMLLFCSLIGLSIWVCSKNPPLAPDAQNPGGQVKILVGLQSNPGIIAPGGSSIVRALVLDQSNQPVVGEDVLFSTNTGTLNPTTATTNDSGFATTIFTASQQPGIARISGLYNSTQTETVTIEINDTSPQSVTLTPDAFSFLANGISSTTIRSVWRNDEGQPLADVLVTFQTTNGSIVATATTSSSGAAETVLTSAASRVDLIAQVTASANNLQATTQVLFKGVEFSLSATPGNLSADGRSKSRVTAVLKETTSTIAISGAQITFGANLGTIPNSATTSTSGVASVDLTSATQTGVSTITAIYGQSLVDTVQVIINQSVPTFLNVSANPNIILADNQSSSIITAVVSDQSNNAVPDGTPVTFAIVSGTGTIESNKVTENGVATSRLTSSTQPDTVAVAVQVAQLSDTTTVFYIVGPPASVTLSADSTSLPADGVTSTQVVATVFDAAGNPAVDGTRVDFSTDIGDITPTAQTVSGQAVAQFVSSVTGTATLNATVNGIFDVITIQLRPGTPNSILLSFDPNNLGVKDSGRNQTVSITADVIDSKNNPVVDGTFVRFSIFSAPGGGEFLSNTNAIPTLNGKAEVSLNSGFRSGSVRILVEVTDSFAVPVVPNVRAVSTEIIIFAGPPFIEDVNDASTSHLSVGVNPLNVFGWNVVNSIATVTAVVGDKFNNPVPPGTAVFFTTTGGVISTYTGYTDAEGLVTVTLHTGQPYPDVNRFYNTSFVSIDPNESHPDFILPTNIIPGPIPDFEFSEVLNSVGNFGENDGIARILAVTEGVDSNGTSARGWSVTAIVFSGLISTFEVTTSATDLLPGESATIDFKIYDVNGNPIVAGSEITASSIGGALSWNTALITGDPGVTRYQVILINNLDPTDPDAVEITTPVTISVTSQNGNVVKSSPGIFLRLN
ncbi:Ig-like domain-containing protein [candidate division KSB1 bacterium]|nr:Ig-like domain-containing protein [candidate division KSB1 bacterium]